jgi:hypothetical protein
LNRAAWLRNRSGLIFANAVQLDAVSEEILPPCQERPLVGSPSCLIRKPSFDAGGRACSARSRVYRISNKAAVTQQIVRLSGYFWNPSRIPIWGQKGPSGPDSGRLLPLTVTTIELFRYKHLYRLFAQGPSPTPQFPAKKREPRRAYFSNWGRYPRVFGDYFVTGGATNLFHRTLG